MVPRIYPSHYPNPRTTRGSGAAAALQQPSEDYTHNVPVAVVGPVDATPNASPASTGHPHEMRLEEYAGVIVDMITVLMGLVVFGFLAFFCLLLTV